VIIGERLRHLRELKKQSQGDAEEKTGLLRCYISRVENGHTVPALETLEKFAHAYQVPIYQMFYDGIDVLRPRNGIDSEDKGWAGSRASVSYLHKLRNYLGKINAQDRLALLHLARATARRNEKADKRAGSGSRRC
jgi:transcriptional regulator with XRE-family HTH domain